MAETMRIVCGNCGLPVAARVVAGQDSVTWLHCPACQLGSVANVTFYGATPVVSPPAAYGDGVSGLPDDVAQAWREARTAHAVAAYTCSEMMCRKILMHIAVGEAGSAENKHFWQYIEDLDTKGYIAVGLKPVVIKIKDRGNRAAHELPASSEEESRTTMKITQHLLQSVYELPGL